MALKPRVIHTKCFYVEVSSYVLFPTECEMKNNVEYRKTDSLTGDVEIGLMLAILPLIFDTMLITYSLILIIFVLFHVLYSDSV